MRTLANYIVSTRFEDLPKDVVEQVKFITLDTLGCAFGGYVTKLGKIYIELAKDMGGRAESTIIGDGSKVSCTSAAFANGYLSDIIDYEDTLYGHPSAGAIPAALSVGERVKASGREFITSVAVGYEVFSRIALAIRPSEERLMKVLGFGTYQPFAAAVPAGKLLGLTEDQMRSAIGIAGAYSPVPSSWKFTEKPKADIKGLWGWTCMAGVMAALHAQAGLTGMSTILEGDKGFWIMAGSDKCDFDAMTKGLGEDYNIMKTGLKPYPSCRFTHATLDAINAILEENEIEANDIKWIKVKSLPIIGVKYMDYTPEKLTDATHSLPYAVAMTVLKMKPGPEWYADENFKDPEVREVAKKVKFEVDPEASTWKYTSQVEVITKDGRSFSKRVDHPKGEPENPLTKHEVESKFMSMSRNVIKQERIEGIIKTVERLEKLEDISELAELLHN